MRRWTVTLLAGLLLALALGSTMDPPAGRAQTSPNHDLSWHVVAGGGREWMAAGGHQVNGTLGQFAIGPAGAVHSVGSGYWYGIRLGPAEVWYTVYLPLVYK